MGGHEMLCLVTPVSQDNTRLLFPSEDAFYRHRLETTALVHPSWAGLLGCLGCGQVPVELVLQLQESGIAGSAINPAVDRLLMTAEYRVLALVLMDRDSFKLIEKREFQAVPFPLHTELGMYCSKDFMFKHMLFNYQTFGNSNRNPQAAQGTCPITGSVFSAAHRQKNLVAGHKCGFIQQENFISLALVRAWA